MMNQRQAVYLAVCSILGREPHRGEVVKNTLTPAQLEQVEEQVVQLFLKGEVQLKDSSEKPRTAEYIQKYVPGLVNNWLRKDKNLNGGTEYVAKNPGSRAGSGDEALMAMRSLLAITKDPEERRKIELEMDARKAAIAAAKVKPINAAALPESLRHLVPSSQE